MISRTLTVIMITVIVALGLLIMLGNFRTTAEPVIAENEFSALFVLHDDYESLPVHSSVQVIKYANAI